MIIHGTKMISSWTHGRLAQLVNNYVRRNPNAMGGAGSLNNAWFLGLSSVCKKNLVQEQANPVVAWHRLIRTGDQILEKVGYRVHLPSRTNELGIVCII